MCIITGDSVFFVFFPKACRNTLNVVQQVPLNELLFVADNLAGFVYQQQDEPLYVMHQIDIIVSVSGSRILDAHRQVITGIVHQLFKTMQNHFHFHRKLYLTMVRG